MKHCSHSHNEVQYITAVHYYATVPHAAFMGYSVLCPTYPTQTPAADYWGVLYDELWVFNSGIWLYLTFAVAVSHMCSYNWRIVFHCCCSDAAEKKGAETVACLIWVGSQCICERGGEGRQRWGERTAAPRSPINLTGRWCTELQLDVHSEEYLGAEPHMLISKRKKWSSSDQKQSKLCLMFVWDWLSVASIHTNIWIHKYR